MPAKLRQSLLQPGRAGQVLRIGLILFFVWLTARHWHPYFGFTRFLQCDELVESVMLPALRDTPLYVYADPGSYDGFYYAQISTDPSLRDPALRSAVDDLGYRARRILLGSIAWAIGLGEPVAIVRTYAWLNVFGWFALAALAWRLFPAVGWRGNVAWTGVLFAAGTLLSVRLALTDLAAVALIIAATMRVERGRSTWASGLLSLSALARETALLGAITLLPTREATPRQKLFAISLCFAAAIPLALWLLYVINTVGSSGAGLRNFSWPLQGWLKKTGDLFAARQVGTDRTLVISSLLGHIALTVQLVFMVAHPSRNNPWWRLGAAFGVLMLFIGPAVWGDDLPGASVRVLLPLGVAFNVIAVRIRSSGIWMLLGNLSVVGGVLALWSVPHHPHEVAAGQFSGTSYVVQSDSAWYAAEVGRNGTWAWCPQEGTLSIETWPRTSTPLRITLALRGFTPRDVELSAGQQVLWRGTIGGEIEWIELPILMTNEGRLDLHLRSDAAPGRENKQAGGRELGFAVCGLRLENAPD